MSIINNEITVTTFIPTKDNTITTIYGNILIKLYSPAFAGDILPVGCKDNNIKLIRIPYTDYDKLDITYIKERT